MRENTDQNNSEYEHFSRRDHFYSTSLILPYPLILHLYPFFQLILSSCSLFSKLMVSLSSSILLGVKSFIVKGHRNCHDLLLNIVMAFNNETFEKSWALGVEIAYFLYASVNEFLIKLIRLVYFVSANFP